MLQVNDMLAYNKDTAIDMLIGLGVDRLDIEEMIKYISADALDQLAVERGGDNYELIADGYYNSIASAVNMIDEFLDCERITKPREKLEALKNTLENY